MCLHVERRYLKIIAGYLDFYGKMQGGPETPDKHVKIS